MALNSLTDRLNEQVELLVTRRQQNWDYLKRAHQGKVHWLNVLKLSKSTILKYFPPDKLHKRIRRWFMLGLSIGRLLELTDGSVLVRTLAQLIEEYEHFIAAKKDMQPNESGTHLTSTSLSGGLGGLSEGRSGGAMANLLLAPFVLGGFGLGSHGTTHVASINATVAVASLIASQAAYQSMQASNSGSSSSAHNHHHGHGHGHPSATSSHQHSSMAFSSATLSPEQFKPQLHKAGKEVVYEYLHTQATCMPDHLDYCEVVHSLMDILSLTYSKFLDPSCQPSVVHDAILRLDRKFRTLILTKICADLNEVCQPLLKAELKTLLNGLFIHEAISTQHIKKFFSLTEGEVGTANAFVDEHDEVDD